MTNFKPLKAPSPYQAAVYDFIQHKTGNAVVSAVAGSGKTTTVLNAFQFIPAKQSILYLAFNRDIVAETKEKISLDNLVIKTLHGYGMGCLTRAIRGVKIDAAKYRKMLRGIYDYLTTGNVDAVLIFDFDKKQISSLKRFAVGEEVEDLKSYQDRILKLCDLGRVNLVSSVEELEVIAEKHRIELINGEAERALMLIELGVHFTRICDFTDIIFLPVRMGMKADTFDWVFIDECQDLNKCQRMLMLKAIKPGSGRFVAVGDEKQAIYGFAGADVVSYNALKSLPNTIELPLSVCYRCGSAIVELVKTIVPQIESAPGAKEGEVQREALKEMIQDGDMVLCRNTYPLVKLCFDYLKQGIKATVKGRDIGESLINMIKATGATTIDTVFDHLYNELGKIKRKIMRRENCTEQDAEKNGTYINYMEKIEIIEFLAVGAITPGDIVDRLNKIFSDTDKTGIQLSTIHKSKGLEADRVFIIHKNLMPSKFAKEQWEKDQENNLIYVAYTRAKSYLGFVVDFDAYAKEENESKAGSVKPVKESNFVGTIGDKYPCELTIVEIKRMNTRFGDTNLITMQDCDGNIFTKFGEIPERFLTGDFDEVAVGSKIRVSATIKTHREYNGVKQNVISHLAKY